MKSWKIYLDKKKRTNELNYENMMLALKPKFSIASTNNDIVFIIKLLPSIKV